MPYALNEANFKKRFTFFVVLKSWKTQITNAVQSKNFYFLLASIQIRRARIGLLQYLGAENRCFDADSIDVDASIEPPRGLRDPFGCFPISSPL